MANTLLQFDAACFEGDTVPVTAGDLAAYFDNINGRTVLVYPDDTTNEYAAVTRAVEMPQAFAGGTLTAKIGIFTAATSGAVVWEVYVEAVTDGDATDLDSTTSFDSVNTSTVTVPATAGYIDVVSITLTNKDSVAAGDMVRFMVRVDTDAGGNTIGANAYVLWLAIQE